jgi:hypothetical protein
MSRQHWHKGRNRSDDDNDDYSDRSAGCPHRHQSSHQDDESHVRLRGDRGDIHENGDRGDQPECHFTNDYGDNGRDHDNAPDGPLQPHDSGSLGWDAAAWDDAGGFEAVLHGHLSNNMGSAGAFPPIIVFAIEDLDVTFNTLNQITQIQNTLFLLTASDGGTIDVGGDVNASSFQSAGNMSFTDFV